VHRIGRTGRAGATGEAISLVCADDKPLLADIETLIRRQVPREVIAGFEPNPNERAEPVQRGRSGPRQPAPRQRPRSETRPARAPAKRNESARQPAPKQKPAPRPDAAPPTRARGVQPGGRARDADSTVRTNIPHLMQTGHRRGR
jgi:ATP-dependent RNA helicase RhlE